MKNFIPIIIAFLATSVFSAPSAEKISPEPGDAGLRSAPKVNIAPLKQAYACSSRDHWETVHTVLKMHNSLCQGICLEKGENAPKLDDELGHACDLDIGLGCAGNNLYCEDKKCVSGGGLGKQCFKSDEDVCSHTMAYCAWNSTDTGTCEAKNGWGGPCISAHGAVRPEACWSNRCYDGYCALNSTIYHSLGDSCKTAADCKADPELNLECVRNFRGYGPARYCAPEPKKGEVGHLCNSSQDCEGYNRLCYKGPGEEKGDCVNLDQVEDQQCKTDADCGGLKEDTACKKFGAQCKDNKCKEVLFIAKYSGNLINSAKALLAGC
ncbi:hypothetical protein N7520_007030 [Penicillium odoratum]|uniref:uncharacterized protein n=1 Tax=Penicillium odoratum TaxID=1167516 RepID=UPI0025478759|nr:uncharacterized protein N7520_007030 [Penicillium odoratum]KAJ5759874.1 hypothetical protein N7520_007030 [Penicillium odoratum]